MKKIENKKTKNICFFTLIFVAVAIIALIANKGTFIDQKKYKEELNKKVPITPEELVPTEHANIEQDSTGTNVPVPKGYVGSPITTSFIHAPTGTVISDGGENTINTGFVIYEKLGGETDTQAKANILADPWTAQCTRNQFVWVPVPDPSTIYGTDSNGKKWGKLYTFSATNEDNITGTTPSNWSETSGIMKIAYKTGYREPDIIKGYDKESRLETLSIGAKNPHDFLIQLEKEFKDSIKSIEKYGGFYIGRYETGGLNATAKVVKEDTNISSQTWYTMYKKSKDLKGSNENVITSMIWGSQFDRTLMWLIESGSKTKAEISSDSGDWGNYKDNTFSYINTSGAIATKGSNTSTRIPSGASEYTRANNIYDLTGNVHDWTIETNGSEGRVTCGSGYTSTSSYGTAKTGTGTVPANNGEVERVARLTLYKVILSPAQR